MTPFHAWRDGIRRVLSAPSLVVVVWTMTTLAALPASLVMRAQIFRSLDHSLEAGAAMRGADYEWMQAFAGQSTPLGTTFRPTIVGFAAVLDNLSALVDNVRRPGAVTAAAAVYALLWVFLSGGVISRYARDRAPLAPGFFGACRTYFFRFFRLALLTAVVYAVLFGALHPWLFASVYPRLTRGIDVERTAFLVRAALYLVFVFALAAANIVFDYAKVRAVVEDRRSMIMAMLASWRFIARHPAGAVGVYLLDAALFAALLVAYAWIAPPGGGVGMMVWPTFLIGQVYIAARLCVRLTFFASETAMVETALD